MAYREIGTGAMSASWLFTGMGKFLTFVPPRFFDTALADVL